MSDCIFCKIVAGEIPSSKVYEDDEFLAFLDIKPVNPGHVLVIPKQHYNDFVSMPAEQAVKLYAVVHKISSAIISAVGAKAFNLGLNNGAEAGQIIFHTHVHIMPRQLKDGLILWPQREYAEGERDTVAQKIRENLNIL